MDGSSIVCSGELLAYLILAKRAYIVSNQVTPQVVKFSDNLPNSTPGYSKLRRVATNSLSSVASIFQTLPTASDANESPRN
ncbi:hypothetical protein CEXT_229851 [Caerostris extrusa]|uniref:Uncharacterized protein n=1 Tax=Caerostris extrusa TaxID=172846 RepID=A0AAV4MN68_CAEEX|nr:hypothetical protein CEXT_229851 [Caerostris extrusa]